MAVASRGSDFARRLDEMLATSGHSVQRCSSLDDLLVRLQDVDLVLVDHDLPLSNGPAACAAIRNLSFVPVIVLGRAISEAEHIRCLEQGADDVLRWPVSERELLARVRAHLRRRSMQPPHRRIGLGTGRTLDLENSLILVEGQAYTLTPTEARLLRALASRLGRPYPVRELIGAVWGDTYLSSGTTDMLRANVYRLRRKLEVDPRTPLFIRFLSGQGWMLGQPTETEAAQSPARPAARAADAAS